MTGANGTAEELEETFAILQELAGETLWQRMYNGADVTTDKFVPFQMGNILQESLLKADEKIKVYAKLVDYWPQATHKFMELHEEDAKEKENRSGKYSPY